MGVKQIINFILPVMDTKSLEGGSSVQSSDGVVETYRGGRVAGEREADGDGAEESGSDESLTRGDDALETNARPEITKEQEAFILKVTEIPLEERKCRDLIIPDALHAYCGGPEPTEEARRLKISPAKLKVQIRNAAPRKKEEGRGKEKEGASLSLPKVIIKGAPKRKGDEIEDRPSKKQIVTPGEHPTKPLSPKHGARKRLMSAHGPVGQEAERRLLTHKGYALEMLESIFREKDADLCVNQSVGELGDSGLFDLARVSMDEPLPSTPVGDTIFVDDDDLSGFGMHSRGDGVVLAQPALDKSVAPSILSADPPSFEGFLARKVQDPSKGDEVVPDAPAP
ncbi:hypothetical protein SO802_010670 [Lithocarpus litseifolius]|uniref:Uncharacterized protein n=1 Tax=Lithocarpus litseifolius TaxID=425828 RepID=A0AAW2DEV0_9ROSI